MTQTLDQEYDREQPFQNCYAHHILRRQNIRISRINQGLEEEILNRKFNIPSSWKKPFYTRPKLEIGIFEKSHYIKNMDFQTLTGKGLGIYGHKRTKFFGSGLRKKGQEIVLSIHKLGTANPNPATNMGRILNQPYKGIPKNHKITYDPINQWVKIEGPNSDNTPYHLEGKPRIRKRYVEDTFTNLIAKINDEYVDEKITEKLEIREIIAGISIEEHKVVCIPKMGDPVRIGVIGTTGSAKSLLLHALMDQMIHNRKWAALMPYLNDWKSETDTYSTPTRTTEFKVMLNNFGLEPMSMPAVYFHPQTGKYDREEEKALSPENQEVSYYISLNWKEIISKGKYNFLFGKFSDMKLEKSARRVPWHRLSEAENTADVFNILGDAFSTRTTDSKGNVITKIENEDSFGRIISTFKYLFSKGLMDIDSGLRSTWKIRKRIEEKTIQELELHPILAAMKCNLVPIFNTQKLQYVNFGETNFLANYIKYLTKLILETKRNTNTFEKELIIPVIDELEEILRMGANEPIIELSALGRQENMGFMWGTPNYTKVSKEILSNTHYLFAMKTNLQEENTRICKDYGASPMVKTDLKTLKMQSEKCKWESYLFHTKPVITYDLDNGEREIRETEPIKIITFPPMSEHKRPQS